MRLWDRSVWYLCLPRIDSACVTALITISSCSASLLARCVSLVATWRSSREVDSVHWTPYKMKPDCRIFTFLILSFTLFQDTQGKFLRNSNTFDKIFFFYFRLLILNGEFHFNFFYRTPILIRNCYSIFVYFAWLKVRSSVCQKEKKTDYFCLECPMMIIFVWLLFTFVWIPIISFPINYYWYLHVLITPRYGHSKASIELVPVLVIPRYGHNKA